MKRPNLLIIGMNDENRSVQVAIVIDDLSHRWSRIPHLMEDWVKFTQNNVRVLNATRKKP